MQAQQVGFEHPGATWNQRYAKADFHFGIEPNHWLVEQVGHLPQDGRILCVADGEGRNSVWLAQQGFAVDAFDIAEVGLDKARRLAAERQVQVNYMLASCDDFAWPQDTYAGIVAIFVQFAPPDMRQRMFAQICRALRPGGVLILMGYTPKQLEYKTGGPPLVEHLYTAELLRDSLHPLDIIALREYEAEIQEGEGHSGRSALIGLVARRPL